ncbi:hypothetical protein CKO25_12620 [Thiocapsa imhoffii]|uniref:Uncharacterized protein n=1 Tax=Thiocapsa imhoffii TaxID=382777 RepID=A0A9X1B9X3_9GAMM|nr:hypothetical protein [Thiocapsa imhoffii]
MHLYQRRPKPHSFAPSPNADFALGKCYLARQSDLTFGRHRHVPVEWRPVVSWAVLGDITYVLPATNQPDALFFHLDHQRCLFKNVHHEAQDSYLCARVEAIPSAALIEIGILDHSTRIEIAQWARQLGSAQ